MAEDLYLVTERELQSATVNAAGELEFTRENGQKINAGKVRGDITPEAIAARDAAVSARDAAVAAKNAAQAVGTTNDTIMAPILADPSSASGAQLRDTIASGVATGTATVREDAAWANRLAWNDASDRIMYARWREAVAAMATSPVRWLALGDSITEGTGVTNVADNWVSKTANRLRDFFPAVPGNAADSVGYTPALYGSSPSRTIVPIWKVTGATNNVALTYGLTRTITLGLRAGSYLEGTVVGTSIDIFYALGTLARKFTVTVDGGAPQTLGVDGGSGGGHKVSVSLGAAGSHTVRITATADTSFIEGITIYNGNENSGIVTANAGVHGWTSDLWVSGTEAQKLTWQSSVASFAPHLVTIMLGANDYTAVGDPAMYRANLTEMVNRIRAAMTIDPTIVLIAPFKRNGAGKSAPWTEYERPTLDLARSLACGYMDYRRWMPDVGTPEGTASGYYVDDVHTSLAGNDRISAEVAAFLASKAL